MEASCEPGIFPGVRSGYAGDRIGQETSRAKRVFIFNDHNLFRAVLGLAVEQYDGFKAV